MNLFTKQKKTHGHRKKKKTTYGYQRGKERQIKSLGLTYACYILKIDKQQGPML